MDQRWTVCWAIVAGLVGAGWYLGACAWRPYTFCRKCGGAGRFTSKSGRTWRRCRRCKGTGECIRLGRRAWTKLNKIKKAAID